MSQVADVLEPVSSRHPSEHSPPMRRTRASPSLGPSPPVIGRNVPGALGAGHPAANRQRIAARISRLSGWGHARDSERVDLLGHARRLAVARREAHLRLRQQTRTLDREAIQRPRQVWVARSLARPRVPGDGHAAAETPRLPLRSSVSSAVVRITPSLLRRARHHVPARIDDLPGEFHIVRERAAPFTMTSVERMYALYEATRHLVRSGIGGDFVECGVWRGGSAMIIALTLLIVLCDLAVSGPKRLDTT